MAKLTCQGFIKKKCTSLRLREDSTPKDKKRSAQRRLMLRKTDYSNARWNAKRRLPRASMINAAASRAAMIDEGNQGGKRGGVRCGALEA